MIHQHIRGYLARERAGFFKMHVFCAHTDVGAGAFFHGRAEAGERRADDNVAARSLYGGNERVDERRGLGGGLIHFPVAGNDGFAFCFVHRIFSVLKDIARRPAGEKPQGQAGFPPPLQKSLMRPRCRRCRAALCPPGIPGWRRRPWRCASSCRHSPTASRQPRCHRRR